MNKTDEKLAVFTKAQSPYGYNYLELLLSKEVKPNLIVVEKVTLSKRYKMAKYLSKKIGFIDAMKYNWGFWSSILLKFFRKQNIIDYKKYCSNILFVNNINSRTVVSKLENKKIEKVALAHSSIIRKKILEIKNLWVINAHPAILPKFRGVDVVKWSLFFKSELGVTLHIVGPKVDTGAILKHEKILITESDSIKTIEEKTTVKSIELLVEASIGGKNNYPNKFEQSLDEGTQFYLMPFSILKQLNENFESIKKYYLKKQNYGK